MKEDIHSFHMRYGSMICSNRLQRKIDFVRLKVQPLVIFYHNCNSVLPQTLTCECNSKLRKLGLQTRLHFPFRGMGYQILFQIDQSADLHWVKQDAICPNLIDGYK